MLPATDEELRELLRQPRGPVRAGWPAAELRGGPRRRHRRRCSRSAASRRCRRGWTGSAGAPTSARSIARPLTAAIWANLMAGVAAWSSRIRICGTAVAGRGAR
ncbi:MAG: hypothetical protein MZV64_13800 [Ignavibacteriales bacterium]|nr:hypothetical protein [Ignavibacteriales bacterium]